MTVRELLEFIEREGVSEDTEIYIMGDTYICDTLVGDIYYDKEYEEILIG